MKRSLIMCLLLLLLCQGCLLAGKRFKITDTKTGASVEVTEDQLKVDPGTSVVIEGYKIEAFDDSTSTEVTVNSGESKD